MEKPVTDTVEAGHRLIAAIEQHEVRVLVGHHRRFDPAVEAAREILESGEIGRLVAISGIWGVRKPDHYYEMDWRRQPGGGPILINLIHDIDMMRLWCGEVESAYAETGNSERGFAVEDSGALVLRFRSGVRATITFSDATPSPWGWERASGDNPHTPVSGENCYRFFGTAASFEFSNIVLWRTPEGADASWEQPIRKEARPLPERAALAAQLRHCWSQRGGGGRWSRAFGWGRPARVVVCERDDPERPTRSRCLQGTRRGRANVRVRAGLRHGNRLRPRDEAGQEAWTFRSCLSYRTACVDMNVRASRTATHVATNADTAR